MERNDLERLLAFDYWSMQQILDAAVEAADDDRVQALCSHLLAAQALWLARVRAEAFPDITPWPTYAPASWSTRCERLHDAWVRQLLEETDLSRPVAYTNTGGTHYTTPLQEIVLHLVLHGQHHRAQVAARLRAIGRTPPVTDYIHYVRQR